MIGVFFGFSCVCLLGILIFKGLTAQHLYKSFRVKGLNNKHVYGNSEQTTELGKT
jgi:hypothetical protein